MVRVSEVCESMHPMWERVRGRMFMLCVMCD